MARHARPIKATADDLAGLGALSDQSDEPRLSERARIVLACLHDKPLAQIARDLNVSLPTVRKWRNRFLARGLNGLDDDAKIGRPVVYGDEFRHRLRALLQEPPPAGKQQWDGEALAGALGTSKQAIWRALRHEGFQLQRPRIWQVVSNIEPVPQFANIVGLYLNPPVYGCVYHFSTELSQATSAGHRFLVETRSRELVRSLKAAHTRAHSLDLIAALYAASGHLSRQTTLARKCEDFDRFVSKLATELPLERAVLVS